MPYSYQGTDKKIAKAYGKDLNVSWKHCNEVCRAIKGKNINKALAYLEKVLKKEDFIPFKRYNTGVPHRSGGQPGRYIPKSVKIIKALLENAKANAEFKDLNSDNLKIEHATASKSSTLERTKPKGRMKKQNIELTNIEIVVKEV